jgi:hypothetical protein
MAKRPRPSFEFGEFDNEPDPKNGNSKPMRAILTVAVLAVAVLAILSSVSSAQDAAHDWGTLKG